MCVFVGVCIQRLTDVKLEDAESPASCRVGEKTAMVRAARQLLSAITKVLLLADRVVVKQLLAAKNRVQGVHFSLLYISSLHSLN